MNLLPLIITNFSLEPSYFIFQLQDNFREKHLIGLKFDMFYKDMFGFNFDFFAGYMLNIRFKFGPKLDVTFLGIANKKMKFKTTLDIYK